MMRNTPSRRIATPGEIADTIAYVASDQASFTPGAIVPVDGGRTAI
jgi:NAD(P)-dependent dehydrogenase (short-subunit alcohol dehydrogenase family)